MTLGAIYMVDGEKFEISYYAKKHSKFITRRGLGTINVSIGLVNLLKPLITYV